MAEAMNMKDSADAMIEMMNHAEYPQSYIDRYAQESMRQKALNSPMRG